MLALDVVLHFGGSSDFSTLITRYFVSSVPRNRNLDFISMLKLSVGDLGFFVTDVMFQEPEVSVWQCCILEAVGQL
jgi:hypothetical protein